MPSREGVNGECAVSPTLEGQKSTSTTSSLRYTGLEVPLVHRQRASKRKPIPVHFKVSRPAGAARVGEPRRLCGGWWSTARGNCEWFSSLDRRTGVGCICCKRRTDADNRLTTTRLPASSAWLPPRRLRVLLPFWTTRNYSE